MTRLRFGLAALVVLATLGARPVAAAQTYVALGDSYSAGVGTRTYLSDSGSCQRSPLAYAPKVAARLGYALTFVACSGARVADVAANQLPALTASTAFVTISIGGNDAGFGHVISKCAEPWPFTCWGDIDSAQAFIRDTLPGQLDGLYASIRSRAPAARVVVVGYPRVFNGRDTCNVAARISAGEQARLNDTADLLAATIAARAQAHGFGFVNAIPPFVGHAVCDSPEWLNGLSDPVSESYHPNVAGYDAYTDLVTAALR
ncbi:MAG TPA: SGNH/GDSL hydrolase family protein [Candidatus Dormibacteraeota bacterium]|nr:SGNH/GDSL hydrolase family protein [Candidatus Dormibacteraeota bacterium]